MSKHNVLLSTPSAGAGSNLTSTVKKLNPKKLELQKKRLENIINETSSIDFQEVNQVKQAASDQAKAQPQTNNNNNDNTLNAGSMDEDYKCKIVYFFRNCTKVMAARMRQFY